MRLPFSRNRPTNPILPSKLEPQVHYDRFPCADRNSLRPMVDLKPFMSKVKHQGRYKSCVAEATAGALEYLIKRYHGIENGKEIHLSRFFITWVGIMLEKEETGRRNDDGSWLPEAISGLTKYGVCPESIWPDIAAHYLIQPSPKAFRVAREITIIPLIIPPNLDSMRRCLNDDRPFLISISCELFTMPDMIQINRDYNGARTQTIGNHAVLVVGYNDRTQLFHVRNSWGTEWGYEGYFYIPYKYLVDDRFMGHDSNGIWAISKIIPRKKLLKRFNNPPHDPKNPFLTLPTNAPLDLLFWNVRRFAIKGVRRRWITWDDVDDTQLLFNKYMDYLRERYPARWKHIMELD